MRPLTKYSVFILLVAFIFGANKNALAQCQDFSISAFNQSWCQTTPYPTSYVTVSFAITEDVDDAFRRGENNKIIVIDLPAGFQFDQTSGTATVANSVGGDISACSFAYNSATQIAITISTINSYNNIDSILFDNFEIRAMSAGVSGVVLRTGGDFDIDGDNNCPGDGNPNSVDALGYLTADFPMVYDSSTVVQASLATIRRTCGDDEPILEIQIDVTNSCATPITQFTFNTTGDVGYSQNPVTNITTANVYYTGTTQGYATSDLFGTVASPNGAFVINGSQNLADSGTHYFYLSYDVPITANAGDGLDARLDSFIFGGVDITDMIVANPMGFRNIIDTICYQPDMPNPAANPKLVKSGSLIIPMDLANQALTAPFNLKAYGLIHNLLLNDVPVRWVIRSGKARNDTDFSALAERKWPSVVAPAVTEFRAGAFVIDSAWVNTSWSPWVLDATTIINNFANNVAVFELKEDKYLDVRYEMNQRPKIAVFDNGAKQAVHLAILTEAGLTPIDTANPLAGGSYVTVPAGLFTGIDECYTFASEPHWKGTLADSLTTDNIRKFIMSGGNFLAQCAGVDTYENFSLINIVSTNGVSIVNANINHEYHNPDLAYMQFEGDLKENEGGSEVNWVRAAGSEWRSGFYYGVSALNQPDTVVSSGAHIISPDSVGGNVFYLGGHDYSAFTDIFQMNAARMYMNASLIPSGRPTLFTLDPGDTLFGCVGAPVQLGGAPTGPADANYLWSPGAYLDDSTSQNPIASPPDTMTYSVLAWRGGCIVGPFPVTINASPAPIVDAGVDQSICGNIATINLTGSVLEATGGIWSTNGSGTFGNDTAMLTTYAPTPADLIMPNIEIYLYATGGCDTSAGDTMVVDFTPIPTVDAGANISICDTFGVALSGVVTIASGGIWTTNGAGTFSPSEDSLNTTYIPAASDTALTNLTLTLTTTGNGSCNAEYDSMLIAFATVIYINAGPDQTLCGPGLTADLTGTVITATGGIWTSLTGGTFSPNDSDLSATYNLSATDIASGTMSIVLTTTGNGICAALQDSLVVTIIPVVSAGPDTIVCNTADTVQLNGFVENQLGAQWGSNGTGSFFPNDSAVNSNYILSPADIVIGSVELYYATVDSAGCAFRDTSNISIIPASTAAAGPDTSICVNGSIPLSGSFTNASGSIWTSSGAGAFTPAPDSLIASYSPDTSSSGTDTITLNTTGSCNNSTDVFILTVTGAPIVDAGPDTSVCDTFGVALSGTVTVAAGGTWTTNGAGTFSPSADSLNTTYIPDASDTALASLVLTLTSTGNGDCNPVADSMIISIAQIIYITAGADQTLCGPTASVTLSGTVLTATGGIWTSSTGGTFTPSDTALTTTYNMSSLDSANGIVTLVLTTTGNGVCAALQDNIIVTVIPVVSAGPDTIVCNSADTVPLSGYVENNIGAQWTSTGTGSFFPNDSSINTSYILSAADIVLGSVDLYYATLDSGGCAFRDTSNISILPPSIVNAGADDTTCANVAYLLGGSFTNAAGPFWTSTGGGTFTPAPDSLIATYLPDTAGTDTISLSTTGSCNSPSDFLILTVTPSPIVDAGSDIIACDTSGVLLSGSVAIGTGGTWTTNGGGTFSPGPNSLNTTYLPVSADTALSSLYLILTSTGNGACLAEADTLIISFPSVIYADAGSDITICADSGSVLVNGTTTTPGGIWTTNGTGTFDDSSLFSVTYTPSAADTIAGSVILTLTSTGNGSCAPAINSMVLTMTTAPKVYAGPDQTVCANNALVTLLGSITVSSGGIWTTDGTGSFADSTALSTTYTPSPADTLAGTVTFTLTTTGNGLCNPVIDVLVVTITPAPVVDAGIDQTICANTVATLSGVVMNAPGGIWTSNGTGTFANDTVLGTTYTPSTGDTTIGVVTLTLTTTGNGLCLAATDKQVLTFTPAPNVDAGLSQAVCENNPIVTVSGIVIIGTSTGTWTSSGSGTFANDTSMTTSYLPSIADIALGSVIITLTSTNNGTCAPVSDTLLVTFTPPPTADAGVDQTICANAGSITLNGSVTIATGGTWTTSGSGTFSPDSNTLNATYTPSAADTTTGSVALVLTTTGNGGCLSVTDAMILTITDAPNVNAGADQTVCADNPLVTISANMTVATGGVWTGGSGMYTPDSTSLNVTYLPSAGEIVFGSVTLVLTSTGNGTCLAESDTMVITIAPSPIVNAGPDTIVCNDNGIVPLSGSVTFAGGGFWTTSGTGSFNDATLLNATYTASSADSAAGSVTLTLTSTGNGTCNPVVDAMTLSFFPGIFVNANADTTACMADSMVTLFGSVSGGTTSGQWTSTGGGTFTPNDTTLNATYVFSPSDMVSGSATVILTSTGNGQCAAIVDSMVITIIPGVNAGPDTIVCNTADTIQLNGSVENIAFSQWATSGTGIFVPNNTTLTAQYILTPADIASGSIAFELTSADTAGLCPSGTDSMFVTIIPPSTATTGVDEIICEDSAGIALSGSFTNASGVLWTSTGGGTFSPAVDTTDVIYSPGSVGVDTLIFNTIGSCDNNADTLLLTVTDAPTVNAGADTSVCATIFNVSFGGMFTVASGAIWSTTNGTGSFTPSDTSMNPTYNGTPADTSTGTIEIVLSTTGNGNCNVHTDTMYLTYTPNLIAVYAGPDTVVCNSTSGIPLNGAIFIATGGTWTTSGSGTFNPHADSLDAVYIPSGGDTLAGNITLTLTTTGNGGCAPLSDDLLITFFAPPQVSAGTDTTICYNVDTIQLIGSVQNAGGGIWSTSGTGTFTPNDSALNVGYVPSTDDVLNMGVTLYLNTYQSCYQAVDSIKIDLVPTVIVWTPDTIVCNNVDTLEISGFVTGAAGGLWATSGSGTFFPDDTSMTTNYVFSTADSVAGSITLTLTSTGVLMGCPPITRFLNIGITPPPSLDAGPDEFVCSNQDSVFLNGATTNAGGAWTSNGTGSFIPDSATLNAVYVLSAADQAMGSLVLTLTTTGSCFILTDSLLVSITPPPSAGFTSSDVCLDLITSFTDVSTGNPTSWSWDFGDFSTDNSQNPQHTYGTSGTYNVSLIVMAVNGCSDTVTQQVIVHPRPIVGFDWVDVCDQDTMFFADSSSIPPPGVISSYSWDFGDGTSSTSTNPYHLYQNNGVYIVTLTAVSDAGCTSTWDTIVVVSPTPVAQFEADPLLVNTEEQIDFTDLSLGSTDVPDTIDIVSWEWNFYHPNSVVGGTSTSPNPSYLYGDTGIYTIQLIVTNQYGCMDTTYEDVEVGLHPIVASGFSPDGSGDSENNTLVVHGGPYLDLTFIIYNEWGAVIFESRDQNFGWDGTFDGVPQPIGVYVYTVVATSLDGQTHHFWGDVTLLR